MNLGDLYEETRIAKPDPSCDSYYCSTCGGQASRVEAALKRIGAETIYEFLLELNISAYLQPAVPETERMFLQHLLDGANWSKPFLSEQQREEISECWGTKLNENTSGSLENLFEFYDYDAYMGRDDHFDIKVVMDKFDGVCRNRQGQRVRILTTENPGDYPIIGAVRIGVNEEEEEAEYRIDGSHFDNIYRGDDLVMAYTAD